MAIYFEIVFFHFRVKLYDHHGRALGQEEAVRDPRLSVVQEHCGQ